MRVHILVGALFLGSWLTPAFGASFDQIIGFGDSLSDTGNANIASGGLFPGSNYASGRFTNGPNTTPATSSPTGLWIDQLSVRLGVPDPQPSLRAGTNYAVASGTTGSADPQDITNQVGLYLLTHPSGASATALYTIWGGSNDLFNGSATGRDAASRLYANIQTLAGAGARNFLWLDLAPLGNTPRGAAENGAALNAQVSAFNQEWTTDMALLQGQGISVTGVNVFNLFTTVAANPGAYGFTNITTPAQGLTGVNPNNYLFWDDQHPTTAGHALIANLAYDALNGTTAVPEPGSAAAVAIGLFSLVAAARIRRRQSSADLPRSERS